MRDHLARGAELPPELAGSLVPADRARFDRYGRWPHGAWSVGLSQGQADCATFRQLARAASGALRITPWRSLVLPAGSTIAGLKDTGRFILDGADPRARVFTCTGAPGCAQARGRTRLLGERIAPYLPPGKTAHVSGCAKGCARSGSADLTVVMQPDGLVGVGYGCRADAPDLHIRPGPKDRDGEPAFLQEITDALHV